MKKPVLLIIGAVIISAAISGFLFLRGNEDTWICDNGQWIAHGHPSSAQPTSGCAGKQTAQALTGDTLPNVPNGLFTELPSETLTCDKELNMHEITQSIFTNYFGEIKTKSCGACDTNPICIQYIPKFKFTALDVDALESKLLALGYTEYDPQKRDLKTDTITFGISKTGDKKTPGIFFSFSLSNQDVTLVTEL